MTSFNHPLQCIQLVCGKNSTSRNILVASAGSKLYSYSAESGQRLSVWPQDGAEASSADYGASASNEDIEGPPEKKRKVDPSEESETKIKNGTTVAAVTANKNAPWTSIPILTFTADGAYLVALTGEDKTIRVFQIQEDGSFNQLSERQMPKRPCAITFTDDNSILTGDKFGDVYSMPLIPSAEAPARISKIQSQPRSTRIAATNLTVHTARNLRSLEMQEQQKRKAAEKKQKQGDQDEEKDKELEKPVFEHDLLLGHVSLLTDVAFASLPSPDPASSKKRTYILSADRDEHIRVSRGPPQAHVIENHCFGHTSFISKLCVPEWAPEYLISGGGDPNLFVWKWVNGGLVQSVPLPEQPTGSEDESKEVAIRGIWASPSTTEVDSQRLVLVALEGNPTMYPFTLSQSGSLTPQTPLTASANILDIQFTSPSSILVSLDTLHIPSSSTEWVSTPSSPSQYLQTFQLKDGNWESVSSPLIEAVAQAGTESITFKDEKEGKRVKSQLSNGLYGLENLRKKMWDDNAE
ncbi:putative tRNA methyltransferase [Aspergillus stella-maris]|uniref:putative tRNA methyltransferase n=1 Tax=Aspergillus stella-maris TaxID=1810926 RepID=UPI003CCD9B21